MQDFVQMQLQEIQDNIRSRRNKIFLLMEEVGRNPFSSPVIHAFLSWVPPAYPSSSTQVRRLRVQQRIKSADSDEMGSEETEMPDIPSTIPFLPRMVVTSRNTAQP